MKIVLTILSGLVILFCGGCAIVLTPLHSGLEFIPIILFLFNVLIVLALWRNFQAGRYALLILGIVDLLLAAALISYVLVVDFLYAGGRTRSLYVSEHVVVSAIALVFLLKGVLSIKFFRGSTTQNRPA